MKYMKVENSSTDVDNLNLYLANSHVHQTLSKYIVGYVAHVNGKIIVWKSGGAKNPSPKNVNCTVHAVCLPLYKIFQDSDREQCICVYDI